MVRHPATATFVLLFLLVLVGRPSGPASAAGPRMDGPMVGHVSPTTAKIWAYAENRPGIRVYFRPKDAAPEEARFADMPPVRAGPRMAEVTLTGLRPATAYVYRVFLRGRTEPHWKGSFRTPPPAGTPTHFKLAVSSCMRPQKPQSSWILMLQQAPDFHLLLGDNVYADTTNRERLWSHYLEMRRVATFAAVLRVTPTYATWDDHDFAGDNLAGDVPGKAESLDAFREVWANPSAGLPGVPGTFFRFSWGDVDFFVLDVRYHRSPLAARNDARKRMIGDAQFAWLARGLAASKARFKVIASGSTIQKEGTDTWVSYNFELGRVLKTIADHRLGGVLWLTGDLHASLIDVHELPGLYPLVEVISSGIANSNTLSFATVEFDTTLPDPTVRIRIIYGNGTIVDDRTFRRSQLELK